MKNNKLGYWPGQDNTCDIKDCKGSGTPEHIDHILRDMTITQLVGNILVCCGDNITPVMSCMCCHFAREIGLRGDPRFAHTRGRYYENKTA